MLTLDRKLRPEECRKYLRSDSYPPLP